LAAVALRGDPDMRILTPADVSAGLPAAAAAAALLGKAGAAIILVLLFLAVTSACSAELIAVSSILTYDIYKATHSQCCDIFPLISILFQTYINPEATEAQILQVGHIGVGPAPLVAKIFSRFFCLTGCALCSYLCFGRCYLLLHWGLHGLALREFRSRPASESLLS